MGIFRKKHKNMSTSDENKGGKTPVVFKKNDGRFDDVKRKKRHKKIRRIFITAFLLTIFGTIGFFGYKAWDSIKDVFANDGNILNLLTGTGQPLKGESAGRTNILLLGVGDQGHDGATLSDSIMVASIDTKTKYVALISIPRDLYIKIPGNGYSKINAAHAYGEKQDPGSGPELAKEVIEDTLGITIHYYARLDFSGLQKVVDSLGGVTVDVENSFCDYNYPTERKGDTRKVCFTKGEQTLNGTQALQYARSRHALGPEGSDFARSRRQQKLILAIKEKALSVNTAFNPKRVLEVLNTLGDHVKTDFQIQELARLYEVSREVDKTKLISKSFDNSPEGYLTSSSGAAGYILVPRTGNFKEIQEVVKSIFNVAYVREEKAKIEIYNGTFNETTYNNLVTSMEKDGYTITDQGPAATKNYTTTQIIDLSGGKSLKTIKALEQKFKVKSTQGTPTEEGYDIKVILGRDYKG